MTWMETDGRKCMKSAEDTVKLRKNVKFQSSTCTFTHGDSACCLGIKYRDNKQLYIKEFLHELVIPFFYRLSYTDKFVLTELERTFGTNTCTVT